MDEKRVEGVVLRATPYKENDRILTVLTPDRGIMSLYVKGLSKKKLALVNLTTPLCRGEFIFKKGRSDLYRFLDGTILDMHLPLRTSYPLLEYGGKMLQAILKTQLPGKDSYALYLLLTAFLKKLPEAKEPGGMWATFQLKLLKHEGLLEISKNCLSCKETFATCILGGESRCSRCGKGGFSFTESNWEILQVLFNARTFDLFINMEFSDSLTRGIDACFKGALMI